MLNLRYSLLLGASLSLFWAGCSDEATSGGGTGGAASKTGGAANTGGSKTGGAAATGGNATATGGSTATGSSPAPTVEAIKAFIIAETYKMAPWKAESATPRAKTQTSPHGKVRVWFNDTLMASKAAGNGVVVGGTMVNPPHTTGSMVVKEMFDDADVKVGVAVNLKVEGDGAKWVYYGVGAAKLFNEEATKPDYTEASPFFKAAPNNCTFCHFGSVFTPFPM